MSSPRARPSRSRHEAPHRGGLRNESAVKVFYGAKVVVPVILCILALVSGLAHLIGPFIYLLCLGLGFLIPDFCWARGSRAARNGCGEGCRTSSIC